MDRCSATPTFLTLLACYVIGYAQAKYPAIPFSRLRRQDMQDFKIDIQAAIVTGLYTHT